MKELLYKLFKDKGQPLSKDDINNCKEIPSYNKLHANGFKLFELNSEFKSRLYDECPKRCLNCDTKIDFCRDIKNKNFCNRSCSASYSNSNRTLSSETKDKISKSLTGREGTAYSTSPENLERLKQISESWRENKLKELLTCNFDILSYDLQRKRIILEQNSTCNRCGLSEWQGTNIPLEIDHKDGINHNHQRENMEALCPNCHALTDTWRGRNISSNKDKKKQVTDEQLVDAYVECGNIHQTLISVGMTPKGNNYGRVKRALSIRGIDYKK